MFERFKPKAATRYPADPRAVFVLGLAVAAGIPLLLTNNFATGTLEDQLPHWGVILWGLALVVGSLVTLFAMTKQTYDGIILEQVGSVIVGAATVFYAGVILWVLGVQGVPGIPFILGFGLSCFWRWGQLQVLILAEYHRKLVAEAFMTQRHEDHPDES